MNFETVFFDFHGVISRDLLFDGLQDIHPRAHSYLAGEVFGKDGEKINQWMRGQLSIDDINREICDATGIDAALLEEVLALSIEKMRLEDRLLALAQRLDAAGVKVALVTDNMDIFNQKTIVHHRLREYFPVIVNSCDHGMLKSDPGGMLFDIAMERVGAKDFGRALLVDDSRSVRPVFEGRGGQVHTYEDYEGFAAWGRENLTDIDFNGSLI